MTYVKAEGFRLSNLYYTLQNNQSLSAIIVIDECDLQQHDEFVRAFSGRGSRLAVFTLSDDVSNVAPPSSLYRLPPLEISSIEEIIKKQAVGLPENVVRRLGEFADGYPRIAVLLTESYLTCKDRPEELISISDDALMNRLIGGRAAPTSEHFKTTKRVLMGLSLFRKIGYEGSLSKESKWLAKLMNVDWSHFREVVADQKRRGIVQGQYYIYVTPFMLRMHLLREWWESYGVTKEKFKEFVESIPEEFRAGLLHRFYEHIPYATTTKRGKEFAKSVLDETGIYSNGSALKTDLGADFFLRLAEADPKSALEYLKRTISRWSKEELLKFRIGRRQVVWALEMIAMWRDLFADAAMVLLKLGEAENETCSNNASGVFAGLFSPAYGAVAPTEASPQERFPVLKEALESSSKEQRLLALQACNQALESHYFARMIGAEYQGLRREPQLWMPKTYGELFDAYQKVWKLLFKKLDSLAEDERDRAVDILLQRSRGIGQIGNLTNMVIETLRELVQKPYTNTKKILETVVSILHYNGKELPPATRKGWEHLRNELTGADFKSLMKRYVGMDLLEDKFDEQGNQVDQTQPRIEELAQEAVMNTNQLLPELEWLVTTEAQNGFRFGYELGKRDKDFSLMPTLIEAQRTASENVSVFFLRGYFRALFEKDKGRWENELDSLTQDTELNSWVPELTWGSGMSDRAALRVLSLAEKGIIGVEHLRMFGFGSVIRDLSEEVFQRWVNFLLDSWETYAVSIALDLYHFFYSRKEPKHTLPKELTLRLLTHESLYQKVEAGRHQQMDDYHWTEIGKTFVQLYPRKSLEIAEKMMEHFGGDGTILERFNSPTQAVLNEITRRYPQKVWKLVTKYLGPPIDSRAFHIKEWLRGGEHYEAKEGILPIIPLKNIWQWVDEDVEKRALYLASFVSKNLFHQEGKICLARELLVRYGKREDVRKRLIGNFLRGSWWGPRSQHYQGKKQQLLNFKEGESNENVRLWIDEFVSLLDREIEQARIEEEREQS